MGRFSDQLWGDSRDRRQIGQDPTDDPVAATYFLFHDCDYATLRWALTTLRAFYPRQLYDTAIELTPEIPSTYVVCTDDRTLRPSWAHQQAALRLHAAVVELDAGHCPHVSQPEALAEILTHIQQR